MTRKQKFRFLILLFIWLSIWSIAFWYDSNFWVWWWYENEFRYWRQRDAFLLSAEEEFWFLPNSSCATWNTKDWNIESQCDPNIKYFTKYLWNWHLNIWNSIKNQVPILRKEMNGDWTIKDNRIILEETEFVLWWERCFNDWHCISRFQDLSEWIRYSVYQVSDPTSVWKIKDMLDAQKFTTRPVRKWADDNLKLYWKSESEDWMSKYHLVDYWAKKEINVEWSQLKNVWKKYREAFVLWMRSVLHWDWQINFHLRWRFNNFWFLEENKTYNDYSTSMWIDWQAFYIANWTYTLNWKTMKWNWKSAVTAWRNHWLYFKSLPNYWNDTKLEDLQRWFRPQLVWSLPFIKVSVWSWPERLTFYTNFYDPRTWQWQLNTHKNKWTIWSWWDMAYDWKFAEDRKRDENWFSSKFTWQWYYPDVTKIWLSESEWWITWENSLYRLWSWKFQDTVLTWMVYRIDDRYSYFVDIWFCWDWLLQEYAWETCDLWTWNWPWSTCSNVCQKQENLCWNWVVDTAAWEECDYKVFETMYVDKLSPLWLWWQTWLIYSWKNNPCYSPDDKAEYEAIWRKACQWKKPTWSITLEPYDKLISDDNSQDIRNIVITDLPYYASINSCQWYNPKVVDKYWINFDKLPYILTYPFVNENFHEQVTWAYTKITVPYENLNANQIKVLKWINSNCNIDMKKNYKDQIQKIWWINDSLTPVQLQNEWDLRTIWADNWNTIKVWSILTNNVAAAYWYDPKSPNINTFINNSWIWTESASDFQCTIEQTQKWENLYSIEIKFHNSINQVDENITKLINASTSNWTLSLIWKTLNSKLTTFYKKPIEITNPITKNEQVQFQWTVIDNWTPKTFACTTTLKFDPQWCYTWVSNWSWINNPSTWNPFDANVWIYSF